MSRSAAFLAVALAAMVPSRASAGTPKYECEDSESCWDPCVLDGECYQPVECTIESESDPDYDGCSMPDWLIAIDWLINSHQALLFTIWRERFGTSDDDSSPCFVHDQCYHMGSLTYDSSQEECDLEFRARMLQQCEDDYPSWNFLARASCSRMALIFHAGVKKGGAPKYAEKETTCCDYADTPDALSTICADAYAHAAAEEEGPPPVPEECEGLEGQCRGGLCAAVDHFAVDEIVDPWSVFHPNGNFGVGWRCDLIEPNVRLVCNDVNGAGRCQACGADTMIGCPCDENDECFFQGEPEMTCRGGAWEGWAGSQGGRCWPTNDVPSWQCAENCAAISDPANESYYCEHEAFGDAVCAPADEGLPAAELCWPAVPTSPTPDYACAPQCANEESCVAHGWPIGTGCFGGSCKL